MQINIKYPKNSQKGFTLIELMIVIAILGIVASIATYSYQNYIRKAQLITIYKEISHFLVPYQTLVDDGTAVTAFTPIGLNMPVQTKYCQFSIMAPDAKSATLDAVKCQIQNLNYLSNESLSLDREVNGNWTCRASMGIPINYLPKECRKRNY